MPFSIDAKSDCSRFVGVATGLLIIVLTYDEAGLASSHRLWAVVGVMLVGLLLPDAVIELRSRLRAPGLAPSVFLVALGTMYLCVPETDQVPVAAVVPAGVALAEVVRRDQLGVSWYALAAASVGWAGIFGSAGRQSALVGALFAWWPFLLALFIVGRRQVTARRTGAIVAVGVAAAVGFARTGGISDSWQTVGIAVVTAVACSLGLGILVAPRREQVV